MEIVFRENMIEELFWKSNHKTSIIKIIIKIFAENHAVSWKNKNIFYISDCSKCGETGASEEQSRKDTSSVSLENEREQ